MAYTELQNLSNFGIRDFLNFPNLNTPLFYPLFLTVIFITFASILFFRQSEREGRAHFLSSLAVAGYVTIVVASILSVLGLIETAILVVTIVIALVFQVIFLLTSRDG